MTWAILRRGLPEHIGKATENDPDLLAEVESFWAEPAFRVQVLNKYESSFLIEAVLQWLQVRPIFLSSANSFVKLVLIGRLPYL